jgi:aromatic-amino-acid transaminase
MNHSVLKSIPLAPKDPILGINELYQSDNNSQKINLGVGVYTDEQGRLPLLQSVRKAEELLTQRPTPRSYLPIEGRAVYNQQVQHLVFGSHLKAVQENRVITIQALGGTGALKIGADFLKHFARQSRIWISDPSWENHEALFSFAGFDVLRYPYYNPDNHGLFFSEMLETLEQAKTGDIVLLHACCHNPTGIDLNSSQWAEIIALTEKKQLVPFLDLAYQGFSESLDEDRQVIERFVDSGQIVFVSNSFSKSFSLYGERVGALSVVLPDEIQAIHVRSQLKRMIRANYSNPPHFGAQIVSDILQDVNLRSLWVSELTQMRDRIKLMRKQFVECLHQHQTLVDFGFILKQSGMFSYSGLSPEQVKRLRDEYSIYAIDSGRICIAALNLVNVNRVAEAVASVL